MVPERAIVLRGLGKSDGQGLRSTSGAKAGVGSDCSFREFGSGRAMGEEEGGVWWEACLQGRSAIWKGGSHVVYTTALPLTRVDDGFENNCEVSSVPFPFFLKICLQLSLLVLSDG